MKQITKINTDELKALFDQGTSGQYNFDPFLKYMPLLLKWNDRFNLTSLTDPRRIVEEHFIDSLQLVPHLGNGNKLLDIGSGAGFPGIPLKIVRPDLDLTLYESIKKKADFMKEVVRVLGLVSVEVVNYRFTKTLISNKFDTIVSRGTLSIADFISLTSQHLTDDGKILMLKGSDNGGETAQMKRSGMTNKYSVQFIPYELPFSKKRRSVVVIRKCST